MKFGLKGALFLLFLVSGFCSLLYQVVWLRLAFASFGVITPVLSLVVSVFMAGLFLGTWAAGKWISALSKSTGISAIYFYALCELAVAAGAFAVPGLFGRGASWLLSAGESDSGAYLFRSALVIAASLFPWCVAMGATIPCMLAYLKERKLLSGGGFSFLYLANVVGAMLGVFLSAVVLIEAVGLKRSLLIGATANLAAGLAAALIGLFGSEAQAGGEEQAPPAATGKPAALGNLILFVSGFTSMGLEVAWTRAFTPVIKTQVYSFALILFTYLLATLLGSWLYRRHRSESKVSPTHELLAWLALSALLPLLLNDPRLGLGPAAILFSIFPFCLGLGYLTPALIDQNSQGDPKAASWSYALNILGCILGPLAASYLLLPLAGVKATLLLLALPFLPLFFSAAPKFNAAALLAGLALFACSFAFIRTYEDSSSYEKPSQIRRDHTATVVAAGVGGGKKLLVNGISITYITSITKVMAHLPLCFLGHKPQSALAICFGMGTTFRSLTSWGIPSTAVELVPSVRDLFPFFYGDAAEVASRPGATIVIDDGRRFLSRSKESFDVITLDPPPPVEAAASSLLYSEQFYALARAHLKPGGILQQWVPGAEPRTLQAMVCALRHSFPHVRMFGSHEGWGYHFLASDSPIQPGDPSKLAHSMPPSARRDLMEWFADKDPLPLFKLILSAEVDPTQLGEAPGITDDRPYNEYYLLRTLFPSLAGKLY